MVRDPIKNPSPHAILFDMDGLLIDSEPLWQVAERAWVEAEGATFRPEVHQQTMGLRIDEAAAEMAVAYGLSVSPAEGARRIVAALMAAMERELAPMAGADDLVRETARRGVPAAIASSSPLAVVERVVEIMGWQGCFDALAGGDEVERGKPDPALFLLAAARLGVAPARCVVLEDSAHGARAALDAGMRCLIVPNADARPGAFDRLPAPRRPTLVGLTVDALLGDGPLWTRPPAG